MTHYIIRTRRGPERFHGRRPLGLRYRGGHYSAWCVRKVLREMRRGGAL